MATAFFISPTCPLLHFLTVATALARAIGPVPGQPNPDPRRPELACRPMLGVVVAGGGGGGWGLCRHWDVALSPLHAPPLTALVSMVATDQGCYAVAGPLLGLAGG
jgi:hypothetical protein